MPPCILMKLSLVAFSLLGEFCLLCILPLPYHALLAPVPWRGGQVHSAVVYFVPYVEPNDAQPLVGSCSGVANIMVAPAINKTVVRRVMRIEGVEKREGNSTRAETSKVAVWLGPFGSCSRDEDERVFCTQLSYSNPQYNLTHIQPNAVYRSETISKHIPRKIIMTIVAMNSLAFIFFLFASFAFWFPVAHKRICGPPSNPKLHASAACALAYILGSIIIQFILNFFTHAARLKSFNDLENFYLPAACGMVRQLKPGLLLKAVHGNANISIWASWGLVNIWAAACILLRSDFVHRNYNSINDKHEAAQKTYKASGGRAHAREMKKFKKEVKKEKIKLNTLRMHEVNFHGEELPRLPPSAMIH